MKDWVKERGKKMLLLNSLLIILLFCGGLQLLATPRTLYTSIVGSVTDASVEAPIKVMRSAGFNDTVVLTLNSPGGFVYSGMKLIKAMDESKAHTIIAKVDHEAYSMAAIIASEADSVQIGDVDVIMFHMMGERRTNTDGTIYLDKYSDTNHKSDRDWYVKMLRNVHRPVLREPEIQRLVAGDDIYITGHEYNKRVVIGE